MSKIKFKKDNSFISITASMVGAAEIDHTHNYAGSTSAGGAAHSAIKLTTSAGAANKPVYFSNGAPAACTYEVNKTVPSNAVFTDTQNVFRVSSQPSDNNCQIWIKPSGIASGRPMVYFRSD